MKDTKRNSKKRSWPKKIVLHKRLNRKRVMASLKQLRPLMDKQKRLMDDNMRVTREVLSREFFG